MSLIRRGSEQRIETISEESGLSDMREIVGVHIKTTTRMGIGHWEFKQLRFRKSDWNARSTEQGQETVPSTVPPIS